MESLIDYSALNNAPTPRSERKNQGDMPPDPARIRENLAGANEVLMRTFQAEEAYKKAGWLYTAPKKTNET